MSDRIAASLGRLFEANRIVVWTDPAREMRDTFDALDLTGVTKLRIANNEFGLKRRILREAPSTRFLLYREGPQPPMAENWLLDIELASAAFRADQAAIWLAELGLEPAFAPVVTDHAEFFGARSRVDALNRIRQPTDSPGQMRMRMLAVCVGTQGALDTVLETLLSDLATGRDDGLRLIDRCGLTAFLWKQVGAQYGYRTDTPDLEDFAISLFKSSYARGLGEDAALNAEALLLLRRWKNDRTGAEGFAKLSERYAEALGIAADVARRDFRDLMELDFFEAIDREIIRKLVKGMSAKTLSPAEVVRWTRERRQSHWFDRYADLYQALTHAAELQRSLAEATLGMTSLAEGFRRYSSSWFRIDQHYRKFIHHMQKSAQPSLLGELFTQVENLYVNTYLLPLNDAWQDQVNRAGTWAIPGVDRQMDFYRDQAAAYRRKDQKVCVIISDALRFEVADECLSRIRALDRFEAELKPMLGVLPSYTQLGMAALLPHQALRIAEDDSAVVVDGDQSTQGRDNREKLLATGRSGDRVVTFKAEELMALRSDEAKEVFRTHDVIYVYHNLIDVIGDKLATEEGLPKAVEDTLETLVQLVRKLTSANASNILITADHGFLYQHRELPESDFSIAEVQSGTVLVRNRRFVVGRDLAETAGMRKFTSAQLDLAGDLDVLIPNSINRLRVRGAGSRYVHGGATLQEVVVPVLRVGKGRESDLRKVEVQIIASGSKLITSGQIAVTFYQSEPVSDKVQPRELRAGIYSATGELISDIHELTFDVASENPRERELSRKFLLSREAERFNNQGVHLRLEEQVGKSSHYQENAKQLFQLRRGIATDFDF
ncbi:BREX-1 system phosphatase PglZ type A [Rubellimicrobium rubrum]|uniref:BREX-1 system phosphatase PglZ type A n=1 Tax=Rubellimicrobium rubrum TaxID=2585369 RepID=A0A5C4MUP9_9RHOB|nr:BREX-1 system phosphatase PglZ type A [Rubellimicrobium rubrum]TNC49326.1 BREX-1 system phosphatase PglZ type A [Rubellimicrobium rubrum]